MSRHELIRLLRALHAQASMQDIWDALAAVCCCEATTAYEADDERRGEEYDRAAEWLQQCNDLHV
jgi:hypothetical protein